MIDLDEPDPLALAAWKSNRLPTNDPTKIVWLMCSFLSVVHGWTCLELVEHYATTSRGEPAS